MNTRNIPPLFLREIMEVKKIKKLEGMQIATSFWDSQANQIIDLKQHAIKGI